MHGTTDHLERRFFLLPSRPEGLSLSVTVSLFVSVLNVEGDESSMVIRSNYTFDSIVQDPTIDVLKKKKKKKFPLNSFF